MKKIILIFGILLLMVGAVNALPESVPIKIVEVPQTLYQGTTLYTTYVGDAICNDFTSDSGKITYTPFRIYCVEKDGTIPDTLGGCRGCWYDEIYGFIECKDIYPGAYKTSTAPLGGFWERYNCYQKVCESHTSKECYDGDVYWHDSCGKREEKKEDCNYGCENGACKPKQTCTEKWVGSPQCQGNKVVQTYQDGDCTTYTKTKEDCGAKGMTCENGACVNGGICTTGETRTETCEDGTTIVTHKCINEKWSPTGETCEEEFPWWIVIVVGIVAFLFLVFIIFLIIKVIKK